MFRKDVIIFFWLSFLPCIYCYSSNPFVVNYSTKNGLPDNSVQCIFQDSRGYLWAGTADGLCRYDGSSFVSYRSVPNDSATISGNYIYCLAEDHEGKIWIGTDKGLNCYDYNSNSFLRFSSKKKLSSDNIRSVVVDKFDAIWCGTEGDGLYKLEKKTKPLFLLDDLNIIRYVQSNCDSCISDNTVLSICFDGIGRGWIGTINGISIFKNDTNPTRFYQIHHTQSMNSITQNEVFHLFCDSSNCIWALGDNGKFVKSLDRIILPSSNGVDLSKIKVDRFLPEIVKLAPSNKNWIQNFWIDKQSNCWVGFYETGVVRFKYPTMNSSVISKLDTFNYNETSELPNKDVNVIYQHCDDVIWFGSDGGLSKLVCSQKFFSNIDCSNKVSGKLPTISTAFQDSDMSIWLGGDRWVGLKNAKTEKIFSLEDKGFNPINCIAHTSSDDLLIGTNEGLYILKKEFIKKTGGSLPISGSSLVLKGNIFSLAEDSDKTIYIGTNEGLKFISNASLQIKTTALTINDSAVRPEYFFQCSTFSNNHLLWIGSRKGLWCYNTLSREYYTVSQDDINALCYDNSSKKLWIATAEGIKCYNTSQHRFDTLDTQLNFMLKSINDMVEDNLGNLWFTTNEGLTEWNPSTKQVNYFNNGIPLFANGDNDCVLLKKKDGTMLAINSNGLYLFDPSNITFNNSYSPLIIEDLSLFGNPIFSKKNKAAGENFINNHNITVDPDQNEFTVTFASPNFINPENTEYMFMLVEDGGTSAWSIPQNDGRITYSHMSPGNYTLYAREINSSLQTSFKVIVLPFLYQRTSFKIALILFFTLLGGLIFFLIYRSRVQKILVAQRIRNKIASDLHDDIGSSLNSISVYSEIVKRSMKDADAKTLGAVESMGNTSRQMIDNMSDIVWAINQKNDDFEQILQRMKHFAGELLAEKHIALQFNYDERVKKIKLPMEKRKGFYLIYKEAINNIYKYSEAKNVEVMLTNENRHLNMTIADDGKGFDEVKTGFGGNGLKNMQARATEVKAKLEIKSSSGSGTQVLLNMETK